MNIFKRTVYALLAGVTLVCTSYAQGIGGSPARDPGEELAKFFGRNAAFSARSEINIKNAAGREIHAMEMTYAFLDGKIRAEMDVANMRSKDMPPEALAQVKQMGMDRTVTIMLPEKKLLYIIYPGLKAYSEMPIPVSGGAAGGPEPKIDRTELGKEMIEGHPCTKSKVIVTDSDGRKSEAIVWQATDMNDFPIRVQMKAGSDTVTTQFKDINQSKPAASLFEPPSDYKRYGSVQEMMMSTMQRMMPMMQGNDYDVD